jgi:hypothetical protein
MAEKLSSHIATSQTKLNLLGYEKLILFYLSIVLFTLKSPFNPGIKLPGVADRQAIYKEIIKYCTIFT